MERAERREEREERREKREKRKERKEKEREKEKGRGQLKVRHRSVRLQSLFSCIGLTVRSLIRRLMLKYIS